jgi:hypothetical protein
MPTIRETSLRQIERPNTDQSVARGTLLGAAVVAFGVIAFGAYSFASGGDQPKPALAAPVSTAEIRTTPDNSAREMPPPVAPSKTP